MEKELILREIIAQNKHWKDEKEFFGEKKYHRKLFFELLKYLAERQIISIVGLRRTGKTILLKQLIRHLVKNRQVETKNILFISFDEALITSKLTLKNYLDVYFETILNNKPDKMRYIFLDEIQYVKKWQHILKRYYDNEPNIKFIISGSSSLFLQKKTTESLAGRIYEFKLSPLSFEEFMELGEAENDLLDNYRKFALSAGSVKTSQNQKEYNLFLARDGSELSKLFEEYLLFYQFPEMVGQTDKEKLQKYISESIYKKAIEYDIPKIFGVEKIDELKFLFQLFVNENGSLMEFKNISSEAGIEENTLKKYISYFQDGFLVNLVYNYSKSFRKSKRLQKKAYVSSTNFFAAFRAGWTDNYNLRAEYFGMMAETYIFNLLREKYHYISFFRKGRDEIDFVASDDYQNTDSCVLAEVKYTNTIRWNDIKFIDRISKKKFKTRYAIYSKNAFKEDNDKLIIPCFLVK